jgi:hypothetical protein
MIVWLTGCLDSPLDLSPAVRFPKVPHFSPGRIFRCGGSAETGQGGIGTLMLSSGLGP